MDPDKLATMSKAALATLASNYIVVIIVSFGLAIPAAASAAFVGLVAVAATLLFGGSKQDPPANPPATS